MFGLVWWNLIFWLNIFFFVALVIQTLLLLVHLLQKVCYSFLSIKNSTSSIHYSIKETLMSYHSTFTQIHTLILLHKLIEQSSKSIQHSDTKKVQIQIQIQYKREQDLLHLDPLVGTLLRRISVVWLLQVTWLEQRWWSWKTMKLTLTLRMRLKRRRNFDQKTGWLLIVKW